MSMKSLLDLQIYFSIFFQDRVSSCVVVNIHSQSGVSSLPLIIQFPSKWHINVYIYKALINTRAGQIFPLFSSVYSIVPVNSSTIVTCHVPSGLLLCPLSSPHGHVFRIPTSCHPFSSSPFSLLLSGFLPQTPSLGTKTPPLFCPDIIWGILIHQSGITWGTRLHSIIW